MVLTDAYGSFTVGEVIQDNSDATIQGIVTSSTGPVPDIILQYYLFNSTQTDFSSGTGLSPAKLPFYQPLRLIPPTSARRAIQRYHFYLWQHLPKP